MPTFTSLIHDTYSVQVQYAQTMLEYWMSTQVAITCIGFKYTYSLSFKQNVCKLLSTYIGSM